MDLIELKERQDISGDIKLKEIYVQFGELMKELLYYGVSAIPLNTTGSEQEGLRACTSFIKENQYTLLEERMTLFEANHAS